MIQAHVLQLCGTKAGRCVAGLASIEPATPAKPTGEDAGEGEGSQQQLRRKHEVFAADCQTNRAIVAAIASGLAAGQDAQQALLALAESAGPPGQHVLLLALCHACASGRAAGSGAPSPTSCRECVLCIWPMFKVQQDYSHQHAEITLSSSELEHGGAGAVACMLRLLLRDAAAMNKGLAITAAAEEDEAHLQEDGLPSDGHFTALAAEPDQAQRAMRRTALLLALQQAGPEDLQRHAGGAAAAFKALATWRPAAPSYLQHLRAIVDAAAQLQPPMVFLSDLFGQQASVADAAVQVWSLSLPLASGSGIPPR